MGGSRQDTCFEVSTGAFKEALKLTQIEVASTQRHKIRKIGIALE